MALLYCFVLCSLLGLGVSQRLAAHLETQQQDPCDSKFGVVADIDYCDRYWECIGGQPQLHNCPNGLAFVGPRRGIAEGCDYPWRGTYCDFDKRRNNAPISTEHCNWLYGIFGHETSCTRYWTCWNGTATEQFCIGGLLYNEETHACDWPQNVQGCQKHPLCREDPNSNVPLGKSCERYWSCQGGYPRLQRCPATLVFDKYSRRCVNPPTEDCEVPTTTPHPDDVGSLVEERPIRPKHRVRQRGQSVQQRERVAPVQNEGFQTQSQSRRRGSFTPVEEQPILEEQQVFEEEPVSNIRIVNDGRRRPAFPVLNDFQDAQPIIFEAPDALAAGAEEREIRQPPIEGAIRLN